MKNVEMDLYAERSAILAALARAAAAVGHDAYFATDPEEPDWPVLFIELPTGQVSWHFHPDDLALYASDIPWAPEQSDEIWDGHGTEEKYRRLDAWRPSAEEFAP